MIDYKACPRPTRSPWGKIQEARELAPGIWTVSTPGHGGIKLSRQRNAAMPDYMRNSGGWYEEDCEWAKVAVVFPIGFQRTLKDGSTEADYAFFTLRNWHPAEWEQYTGMTLKPGDSLVRDEQIFKENSRDQFVVRAAWASHASWVPAGMIGVHAHRENDGAAKYFLVSTEEYHASRPRGHGFVIEPSRHQEVQGPPASATSKPKQ